MKLLRKCVFMSLLSVAGLMAVGCVGPGAQARDKGQTGSATMRQPFGGQQEGGRQLGPGLSRRMRAAVGFYFKNRALDFLDTFEVGIAGGTWGRIEVQYLIGTWGFGATGGQRWRLGRRSFILDEDTVTLAPLPFPVGAIVYPLARPLKPWAVPFFGGSAEEELAIWPDPVSTGIAHTVDRIRIACLEADEEEGLKVGGDSFMIGAEVHILLGARARVMPVQLLDFVTGLFGWDPLRDDTGRPK